MNKSKLRALAAAIILPAAGMSCATTGAWQTLGMEERPTGIERTIIREVGSRKVKERSFDISNPYIEDGVYKSRITESADEATYISQRKDTQKEHERVVVEQRTSTNRVTIPLAMAAGGALGGLLLEAALTRDSGPTEYKGVGALIGGVAFGLGGLLAPPLQGKTETRERSEGQRDILFEGRPEESLSGRKSLYSRQPARNVKVGVLGNPAVHSADEWGIIGWSVGVSEAVTKEELEKKLYDIPLIKQIKPETREALRQRLLDAVSESMKEGVIETREKPINGSEEVKNCQKRLAFRYFVLTDGDIYNVVRAFVDEEINSSVRTLRLSAKDDLTHFPIEKSNLELATSVPSKAELAGEYFTGELKTFAEKAIKDYLRGKSTIGNSPSNVEFLVYSPSRLSLEVTHPDYNFVAGEVEVDGDEDRTVFMVDKGNKVRLAPAEESSGRIEESP